MIDLHPGVDLDKVSNELRTCHQLAEPWFAEFLWCGKESFCFGTVQKRQYRRIRIVQNFPHAPDQHLFVGCGARYCAFLGTVQSFPKQTITEIPCLAAVPRKRSKRSGKVARSCSKTRYSRITRMEFIPIEAASANSRSMVSRCFSKSSDCHMAIRLQQSEAR